MASAKKKFKLGDVVMLNSGGPRMTVTETPDSDDDEVYCLWFCKSDEGDYMTGDASFPPECLAYVK